MANSEMSDLFMYVVTDDGGPLDGESSMAVEKGDDFMEDYFKSSNYDTYANFFDVTDFQFSMKLGDGDKSGSSAGASLGISHSDWYLLENPVKNLPKDVYQLEKVSGSFGKVLDSVSPAFFQKCCEKATFEKMILVKRALTGHQTHGGESKAFGYLRILMEKVRITAVAWTDGDFVEEKINFKCQHLEILYKKQSYSGRLDRGKVPLVNWTWSDRAQQKSQGGR